MSDPDRTVDRLRDLVAGLAPAVLRGCREFTPIHDDRNHA